MPRCLGKQAGLAVLTSEERWKCQPLKTGTGWIVSNFSTLCTQALHKLCPGDTDVSSIPNPGPGGPSIIPTTFPGGPGSGSTSNPFEQTPTGQESAGNGGGPPDALCALAGMGNRCTWLDLINAGIDVLGGGDGTEEPPSGPTGTPDEFTPNVPGGNGECPGDRIRVAGLCVKPSAALPGGEPLFTGADWSPVRGMYGPAFAPKTMQRTVRKCPKGFVLGNDGACYDHLPRSKREWDPGMKPLLTGGDRAAIRKAATAARKLKRAKKQLKKSARALEKVS